MNRHHHSPHCLLAKQKVNGCRRTFIPVNPITGRIEQRSFTSLRNAVIYRRRNALRHFHPPFQRDRCKAADRTRSRHYKICLNNAVPFAREPRKVGDSTCGATTVKERERERESEREREK